MSLQKKLSAKNKRIIVFDLKVGGWGRAVKFGISKALGEYVCYTNSARTNPDDLKRMLSIASLHQDMIIKATRIVREAWFRKVGSIIYNLENRLLLRTPVWDINGTPKIFPKNIISKINISEYGDLIDAEIMAKCHKNGNLIIEFPTTYTKRISGKSTTNISSAVKMYLGLIRLKNKIR